MLKEIVEAVVMAVSVCADCFAVSICSGISLKDGSRRSLVPTALAFGVVQTFFLAIGSCCGNVFLGSVERFSHIIGFVLLALVGGSMIRDAFKETASVNLSGIRGVAVSAMATSIDALAVGVSLSMAGSSPEVLAIDSAAVFVVTVIAVLLGLGSGRRLGLRFGSRAELAGGSILILLGLLILLGKF